MVLKLYVGNLSRQTTIAELQQLFAVFGHVESITISKDKFSSPHTWLLTANSRVQPVTTGKDRFSGEPRGFAFVEMPVQAEALAAIAGLTGYELHERCVHVNAARPRHDVRGIWGQN